MFSKRNAILLIISNLAFIALYAMLGYYNRIVPEDYIALIGLNKKSLFGIANEISNTWGGRLLADFFALIIIWLNTKGLNLIWFHLVSLLLLIFPIYKISSHLSNKYKLECSKAILVNVSILFVSAVFYLTISLAEGWFWILSATVYLWCIIMALWGWSIIITNSQNAISKFLLFILFFYVGDASEPFALLNILALLICIITSRVKKSFLNFKLLLIAASACIVGFTLMYFAPGTQIRKDAMPEISLMLAIKRDAGAIIKFYLYQFPQKIFYTVLFGLLFFFIAQTIYSERFKNEKLKTSNPYLFCFYIFNIILFMSLFPVCYIMGEGGPLRSWNAIMFYFTVFLYISGFIKSRTIIINIKNRNIALTLLLTASVFTNLYTTYNQYPIVKYYAKKVDERNNYLLELKKQGNTSTAFVAPLPENGFLYKQELSSDTSNFANQYYAKGLNLGFAVACK
jgi:hypothetical protein